MEDEARDIIKKGVTNYLTAMLKHEEIQKRTLFAVAKEVMLEMGDTTEETEEVVH